MTSLSLGLAFVVLSVTSLCFLVLNGLLSWLRTAWMLRKLPRGSKNLYDGLAQLLKPNRLRSFERINEHVVNGSGVFYYSVLWRQVRLHERLSRDAVIHQQHADITSRAVETHMVL